MSFEIATWYDTWNRTGLDNLVQGKVPLHYASRYNLAFGVFEPGANGYYLNLNGAFAGQVLTQIRRQAPNVRIYAGTDPGGTGLSDTVADNRRFSNRSTENIFAYLRQQGLNGIAIDAEENGRGDVAELVSQLGPRFKAAGLGIAVSAPWPGSGPVGLYGKGAVEAFNQHVDAIELQDYSSGNTPNATAWIQAGVRAAILMGGICTENSGVQTTLQNTADSTLFALKNQLRGMFSWRLDNDHGLQGQKEDIEPTFTGAKAIYDTVNG
ncbi:MAG TPA: hypothetical protein VLB76_24905 [Thermoanaerobaculia bacterium]|jgi:hypothetical protein|nr:hypothetical protein [Thermoanaerobaculia bacterium]